jgi:AcrR family transcriptional regulator
MPGAGVVRRKPVQRRSIERVNRLLDACASVLDDVGYDRLTTREVARRAGIPIGTLYQFFGGKQALCGALARRNLDLWVQRLHDRLAGLPVTCWSETAAVVVEEFVAMKRTVPGFGVVDFGDVRTDRPILLDGRAREENNTLVARRLARFGVEDLGLPAVGQDGPVDDGRLLLVLRVAVELADGLLRLAFRAEPEGDPELIAEAGAALRGYLAARLG